MDDPQHKKIDAIKDIHSHYRRKIPSNFSRIKTKEEEPAPIKKKGWSFWRFIKRLFILGVILVLLGVGAFALWVSSLEIPSVDDFDNIKISNSTKIYDRTGEILLYDIHENIRREVVDSDEISLHAKNAIIAIEDHSFYEHKGVVVKSTIRGVIQTIMARLGVPGSSTAGGSTLTQQLVKNTLLNSERRVSRKIKEWVLAYKIEQRLTKDEILTRYLNEAPYGGTVYGIQEASRVFFGKSANEITIAEAAYLAAIPNLPTFYSPYGPNVEKLNERQRIVLGEMKWYGLITDGDYQVALLEDVEFKKEEENFAKALHFVQYVRAFLEQEYGQEAVENGGLHVITTLDYELQQEAEQIIAEHVDSVEEEFEASNAGLLALEPETGQIITMVGSRDYFSEDIDGNFNVTIAQRQPGSSFKPIAYATAFEKGYLPETIVFDVETQFNSSCEPEDLTSVGECYAPGNHDARFKGPMNLRNALAQSRNISAIKVLHLAGLNNVLKKARDMGIRSLKERAGFYGLTLVLGGGEVSLLEMVSAYGSLGNDGLHVEPIPILSIVDVEGEVLFETEDDPIQERVVETDAARMVNDILSDNIARSPLFGSNSFMYFGDRDVAAKTGTTNDNRDAWLIGYTPNLAVGVWTGNNDNSSMKRGSSISGAPWRAFMDVALEKYPKKSFGSYDLPSNFNTLPLAVRGEWLAGEVIRIDSVSGKLATEFTPEETIVEIPNVDPHSILHWINKNDPRTTDTSHSDAQYENWEYGVKKYVEENLPVLIGFELDIPTEYDDVHTEETQFNFDVLGVSGDRIYVPGDEIGIALAFGRDDRNKITKAEFFVNNLFVGSTESKPFSFVLPVDSVPQLQAENELRVVVTNELFSKAYNTTVFQAQPPEDQLPAEDDQDVEDLGLL